MKLATFALAAALALTTTLSFAQTNSPGGPAATSATGDPAASSAKGTKSTTTGASRSGSGTSTSGGKDDNGDQGRDAMPDSSQGVRPLDKQNKH
jgi:hypothetical protein